MGLAGLSQVNIELSSKCLKRTLCSFCFHQQSPNLQFGDMNFELLKGIRAELEPGSLTVQFHRDGDPLSYDKLGEALDLFGGGGFIRNLVTHGETLHERADEIIDRCESVTVSVFGTDPDANLQYEAITKFLERKGTRLPRLLIKAVGVCDVTRYAGLPIMRRRIHTERNDRYVKAVPMMFESGICQDFLSKPAIAWNGRVYQCVRFDDREDGYLGSLYEYSLDEIWNGPRRKQWLAAHIAGKREQANARCAQCTYYGVPVCE